MNIFQIRNAFCKIRFTENDILANFKFGVHDTPLLEKETKCGRTFVRISDGRTDVLQTDRQTDRQTDGQRESMIPRH